MCLLDTDPITRRRSSAFIVISMSCLVLAILWHNLPFTHSSHPDLGDFFHGLLYGLSFGFSIGALIVARGAHRGAASPGHSLQS